MRPNKNNRIPGESRDPCVSGSTAGSVDPGFRRECCLYWSFGFEPAHSVGGDDADRVA
jgi:hypothetical protein